MTAAVLDPLAGAAIRVGHREMLETVAELTDEVERGGGAEAAGAAVAFLRQSVLPFARREEAALAGLPDVREGAAFEHAFLAAEVDALAAEVREDDGRAVLRRMYRIQAALELHAAREEERDSIDSWTPPPSADADADAPRGGPREMPRAEVDGFLAARTWGMLATADADGPYAVPVSYGWDGEALYVATGPGRKLRHLESSPALCLTVPAVEGGDRWRCVVARGRAVPVDGTAARIRALALVHRQRDARSSLVDAARAARARVFRLVPAELTGRARG